MGLHSQVPVLELLITSYQPGQVAVILETPVVLLVPQIVHPAKPMAVTDVPQDRGVVLMLIV